MRADRAVRTVSVREASLFSFRRCCLPASTVLVLTRLVAAVIFLAAAAAISTPQSCLFFHACGSAHTQPTNANIVAVCD